MLANIQGSITLGKRENENKNSGNKMKILPSKGITPAVNTYGIVIANNIVAVIGYIILVNICVRFILTKPFRYAWNKNNVKNSYKTWNIPETNIWKI